MQTIADIRITLERGLFDYHTAVSEKTNIVFSRADTLNQAQMLYIITQYCQFPENIVSVLVNAAYTFGYHGWTGLTDELRRNVFEEMGGGEGSIAPGFGPHYSILRRELQNIFGTDIQQQAASEATAKFLRAVKAAVRSAPLYTAGAVYALEASAVPELDLIFKLVKRLADATQKKISENLKNFFIFHINDIEIGHRDRLLKLAEEYLSVPSDLLLFYSGYDSLLDAMDMWWTELYREAQIRQHEPLSTGS